MNKSVLQDIKKGYFWLDFVAWKHAMLAVVFFHSVLTNICAPFLLHFFPFLSFPLPSVWMYGLQDSPTKSEASGNCFICVHVLSLFLLQLLNVVIFPVFTRTVPKTALAHSPTLTLFKRQMWVKIDFGKELKCHESPFNFIRNCNIIHYINFMVWIQYNDKHDFLIREKSMH